MKYFIISLFIIIAINSCKQDSGLLTSWNNLGNQFVYRIELLENIAKSKPFDEMYLDSLKNLRLLLKSRLNQAEPLDSLLIRDIKNLNKRLISFFPQLLFSSKNDSLLISPTEFRDIQTSLESMEHRISMAQKEYNEVCYKLNRKDLVYESR